MPLQYKIGTANDPFPPLKVFRSGKAKFDEFAAESKMLLGSMGCCSRL